jgi:hypothetical protein
MAKDTTGKKHLKVTGRLSSVPDCSTAFTKGRCLRYRDSARECGVFVWKRSQLKLKDARCPMCGSVLRPTVHYIKKAAIYQCSVVAG